MRSILLRALAVSTMGMLAVFVLGGASAPKPMTSTLEPDKIAICSVSDVKGKTSPCGCHVPKGGLARQASFMDSIRTQYGQLYFVDNGGFFPEDDLHQDAGWFLMDAYKLLGVDAVGVADRDLRFGLGFLRENARSRKLPIVCANLIEKKTGKTAFPASIVVQHGGVKVGFFGLVSDKADLGPSRDSLQATDPAAATRTTIADLRKKGAQVVVALSNLGKAEGEDLCTVVDGIDVMILGRNVPLIQKGRLIKTTLAVYGGEQGQNMARTLLTLDAQRKVSAREADVYVLGPQIPDKPEVLQMVKDFEDALNEKLRKAQKQDAAEATLASAENNPDHFVGAAMCERCHKAEAEQWRTTAHARAWQTLVDNKKDADPDCIQCHVVGFRKPGGFVSAALSPTMANVQCESCHGVGTQHEAFKAKTTPVTEATCRQCHNETTSPEFSFAVFEPHILHQVPASLPPLPQNPGMKKALGADSH